MTRFAKLLSCVCLAVALQSCARSSSEEAAGEDTVPAFPWPAPKPSARTDVARAHFQGDATLGAVADRLVSALARVGLSDRAFYSAPGGFALVARLERIDDQGRAWPMPGRFAADDTRAIGGGVPFSLSGYLRALFTAAPGRYRVLVFLVTATHVVPSSTPLTAAGARIMLDRGADSLTERIEAQPFTTGHRVNALIYEFVREQGGDAMPVAQSNLQGEEHLRQEGLLTALRQ